MKNKHAKLRILELSHKHGLSHIGSCWTAIDILLDIYKQKGNHDVVILSAGHAGLAQYVALEEITENIDAEKLLLTHGIHPNRDIKNGIFCSTGSLGHGIGIAVGAAMAQPHKQFYIVLTDGECSEGSVKEALSIANEHNIKNIHIKVNANGWSAYRRVYSYHLSDITEKYSRLDIEFILTSCTLPGLEDLPGHYNKLTDENYQLIKSSLC